MDKRNHALEKAGLAIPEILAENKLLVPYKLYQVKRNWEQIVGPQIAKYSYILDFKNHCAIIAVLNPVWMNQLFMYKQKIIDNINEYIKDRAIRDIRFVRSGRKPPSLVYDTVDGHETAQVLDIPVKQVILPDAMVAQIRQETAALPEAIRERVAQWRFAQEKRKIAYGQAGFTHCPGCGRWLPPGQRLCFICQLRERQERKQKIHDILEQMPWLTWDEMIQETYVPEASAAYAELYNEVRRDLIYKYIEKIHHDADTLADDLCLALLITRQKPGDIAPDFIRNLTEKYRRKDHVRTHRQAAADCHAADRGHRQSPSEAPE